MQELPQKLTDFILIRCITDMNKEKDNIKNFSEEKKKTENKKKNSRSKVILALLAVIVVVFVSLYFLGGLDVVSGSLSGGEDVVLDSSVIGNDGFPVSFTNNDIITVKSFSSRLYVLTSKLLTCIRPSGEVAYTETFTFVEPEMAVSEKYGMVYDRGSSKYFIFNKNGLVYEGNTEDNRHIITASIDSKGNCAVATKSDDSACRVYLMNKKGRILYIWSCAEEYAVSLDISSDSKEILCGTIGAYNGEIYTKLYKLETDSDEVTSQYTILGSGCVDVKFYGKEKAIVSCLDKRVILHLRTEDGSPIEIEYSGETRFIDCDSNGYAVVVTDKINSFDEDEITLYDKNNSVIYKSTFSGEVNDIVCIGKKVFCLTDDSVVSLDSEGSIKNTFVCDVKGEGVTVMNNKPYFYTSGVVEAGF